MDRPSLCVPRSRDRIAQEFRFREHGLGFLPPPQKKKNKTKKWPPITPQKAQTDPDRSAANEKCCSVLLLNQEVEDDLQYYLEVHGTY